MSTRAHGNGKGPVTTEPHACPSTRDGEPCARTTLHRESEQHRGASGRRWYYGDDMQRGMPRRYLHDHTPLVDLITSEMDA